MNKCSNCKYSQHIDGDVRYWCMGQKNMPVVLPNDTCKDWKADRATNADKIRQMSDEELVDIWYFIYQNVLFAYTDSRQGLLDWLKQEVESDG